MNKKDLDKIKLPDDLDNIIDDAINKADEDKEKNTKRKWYKKGFGSVAAGLAIVATLGVGTTTLAYSVPSIRNAFEKIQNEIWNKGDYSKYATEVNQTVFDNGVGVTLSEVLCDGQNLYVSYIIESEEPFKYIKYEYDPVKDYDITKEQAEKIENTQLDYSGKSKVSFTSKILDNTGVSGLEGRFIDNNTFVGIEEYNLTDLNMEIPDEFVFTMNFDAIVEEGWNSERDKRNILKGNWNFKVPVKVDKSLSKITEVNDINNDGIGVDKVILTPLKIKVFTTGYNDDYRVRAYDENGNRLDNRSGIVLDKKGDYLTTIARNNKDLNKIKIEIYIPHVDKTEIDKFENSKETILYSKEVNLVK